MSLPKPKTPSEVNNAIDSCVSLMDFPRLFRLVCGRVFTDANLLPHKGFFLNKLSAKLSLLVNTREDLKTALGSMMVVDPEAISDPDSPTPIEALIRGKQHTFNVIYNRDGCKIVGSDISNDNTAVEVPDVRDVSNIRVLEGRFQIKSISDVKKLLIGYIRASSSATTTDSESGSIRRISPLGTEFNSLLTMLSEHMGQLLASGEDNIFDGIMVGNELADLEVVVGGITYSFSVSQETGLISFLAAANTEDEGFLRGAKLDDD